MTGEDWSSHCRGG